MGEMIEDIQTGGATAQLVIDCDAGQDDAVALLVAFGAADGAMRPSLVTTVVGNSPGEVTNRNARSVVAFAASAGYGTAPVYRGMDRAILRPVVSYFRPGENLPGWDNTIEPVPPTKGNAVTKLVSLVRRSPAKSVTICALGPLTNVAMAILLDQKFASRLGRVAWMGGSIGRGNITPAAEFNAHADPEAARIVFDADVDLVIIPAEIGELAAVDSDFVAGLDRIAAPMASAAAGLIKAMGNQADHDRYAKTGYPMYDPTVVALLADASMFTLQPTHAAIDINDGPSTGATHFDLDKRTGRAPNVVVAVDIDTSAFQHFIVGALSPRQGVAHRAGTGLSP